MTDQERISLILVEMERTAILRAAKSKALMDAVAKISLARVQVEEGIEAERLAEDEILKLQTELADLESVDQRNAQTLRSLQSIIAVTEELATPTEPIVEEETPTEPTEEVVVEEPPIE